MSEPMGLKSRTVFWMAGKVPALAKIGIWLWVRLFVIWHGTAQEENHWALRELSDFLSYRVPVNARLINGMAIRVPWNDVCGRAIFRSGCYEPETLNVVERLLMPGMVFFDVGAQVGQYTLIASKLVGPTGQIHSFEPDRETFEWLSANVRLNALENVQLNSMALFRETSRRVLYLAQSHDIGSNSLSRPLYFSGHTQEVETITVDEYMRTKLVDRIDMIKIDVEGAELAVLEGATALLTRENKPLILIEFEEERQRVFGSSCATLAEFLRRHGYTLFRIGQISLEEYVQNSNDLPSFNVLATPESKKALIVGRLKTHHSS